MSLRLKERRIDSLGSRSRRNSNEASTRRSGGFAGVSGEFERADADFVSCLGLILFDGDAIFCGARGLHGDFCFHLADLARFGIPRTLGVRGRG